MTTFAAIRYVTSAIDTPKMCVCNYMADSDSIGLWNSYKLLVESRKASSWNYSTAFNLYYFN